MSKINAQLLSMRMDMKDMLNYRVIIERKRDKAFNEKDTTVFQRLNKQLDIMDMMFETVWVATMTDAIPEFQALTGGDFDISALKLVLPQYSGKEIGNDTQVKIVYVEEEPVASNPASNEEDFMEEIKKLLSKSITKNIPMAIEIYNQRTGKNLMPADAYTEIKDALPEARLVPIWDKVIATQYRMNGAIAAYSAIKKWLPTFGDSEIGRICEDALKRTASNPQTPAAERDHLNAILSAKLDREIISLYKKEPINIEFVSAYLGKKAEPRLIEQEIGRLVCMMNPEKRIGIEAKSGRKAYVEKGY